MNFTPGQILVYESDNRYGSCKVLTTTEGTEEAIISVVVYRNRFDAIPENINVEDLNPFIIHVPISQAGMMKSGLHEVGYQEVTEEELKGYHNWLEHWKNGQAGYFTININACVDYIFESKVDLQDSKQTQQSSAANAMRERMQKGGFGFPF